MKTALDKIIINNSLNNKLFPEYFKLTTSSVVGISYPHENCEIEFVSGTILYKPEEMIIENVMKSNVFHSFHESFIQQDGVLTIKQLSFNVVTLTNDVEISLCSLHFHNIALSTENNTTLFFDDCTITTTYYGKKITCLIQNGESSSCSVSGINFFI
ncbi:hypothetical protein QTN25_001637 [Entamoeba marina]